MKIKIFTILLSFFYSVLLIQAQNNALEFDGSNDYATCGTNVVLNMSNAITLEAWVYMESYDQWDGIATYLQDNGTEESGYGLIMYNSKLMWWAHTVNESDTYLSENPSHTIPLNTWIHIAGTYDGSEMKLYINGVLENSKTKTNGGPIDYTNLPINFSIGAYLDDNEQHNFDGKVDELKLWNTVRTESEIRQNMYQELNGNESGLVAYYQFNETSGTSLDDLTSNNNNGTLINMTGNEWETSPAIFGPKNSIVLDGNDDFISVPNSAELESISGTFEAWIRPDWVAAPSQAPCIISMRNSLNNSRYSLHIAADKSAIGIWTAIEWYEVSYTFESGQWYHVSFVYDNSNTIFLINGEIIGIANHTINHSRVGLPLTIGHSNDPLNIFEYFDGAIDEVRVWNTTRTDAQIQQNMFKSLSGNESGLVAYYNFDNESGTTLQDFSGNENDGTLTNMVGTEWSSSAAYNTWLNTNSNNPATTTNWSRGAAPSNSDNVGVYNFSGSDPVLTSSFDCNNFLLENGAGFTMNDGASFIAEGNEFVYGSFTINKTLTNDNKWHLISMPNNNTTANNFYGDYLQNWNENFGIWEDIDNPATALIPVKAYGFYGSNAKANYSFTGTPNTGEQEIALTVDGVGGSYNKANAVGNPYPSAIDWAEVSGYGAKYTWNGMAYEAYSSVEGYTLGSQFVAPFQGFFVIPDESGTFTLNNDDRTHSGAGGFEKSSKKLSNGLVLFADNGSYKDKLLVLFNDDADPEFELEKDAWKILSNTEGLSQIYSLSNDQKLSIDNRPACESIPLGFLNDRSGLYTIGIFEANGITAELEDTKLNKFHNISQSSYSFDWEKTESAERFILHLKATGTEDMEIQESPFYSFDGRVYIRQNESNSWKQVVIYDLSGRIVAEYPLTKENLQSFNLEQAFGAYLVQLVGENASITDKVILK